MYNKRHKKALSFVAVAVGVIRELAAVVAVVPVAVVVLVVVALAVVGWRQELIIVVAVHQWVRVSVPEFTKLEVWLW